MASEPYYRDDAVTLYHGDCRDVLPALDAGSVDAIVTDPPYGLEFMGKGWDKGVPDPEFWTEALRVAKPGAHLVAFGGTRTYHRLACAIEDAGWEIRDGLVWLYGSGFPKSLDVSKAIDKAAGAAREVVGVRPIAYPDSPSGYTSTSANSTARGGGIWTAPNGEAQHGRPVTAPATDAAKQWAGWGTALKPAWEPIILARKPLAGTVAANVLAHGTGALNVDGCRIGTTEDTSRPNNGTALGIMNDDGWQPKAMETGGHPAGRWPANVVLDEDAAALLNAQSGAVGAAAPVLGTEPSAASTGVVTGQRARVPGAFHADTGGASRFFYTAKASRAEREAGMAGFPVKACGTMEDDAYEWKGTEAHAPHNTRRRNGHPTVKPLALMRWLVRLVTPPGGLVLDPFAGSGTTGCAAAMEGCRFLGIERDEDYVAIARARLAHYAAQGVLPLFADVDGAA